jgi:limonene-1,2-epoxide hydrolase
MTSSHSPDSLVREFISLLVSRDLAAAAAMVTDDFEYDNGPMGKTFGPEAIENTLSGFFGMCTGIDWIILRQTSSGTLEFGTVLNERDDRIEIHGRWTTLPVAGVFEIRDGKISLWRDYFDKQTIIEVMTPPAG